MKFIPHHCRTCWSGTYPKTLHFATQHASDGIHMPIAVWGIGGLWTMEADAMACGSLVQPSEDCDELSKQTGPNPLQYSNADNTVDEAVRSITAMQTRGWSSRAVVTLHGPIPTRLCVRPSSFHWFHTRITVVAACHAQVAMSRYDKPASRWPTILPRSNALACWYCALSRRRGILALAFTFQLV